MSPSDTVIMAVVVIVGSTMIKNAVNKKNSFQPILFGFMLAIALLILGTFAPNFTKGLAYMGMIGAFIVNGPAVFKLTGDIGSAAKKGAK